MLKTRYNRVVSDYFIRNRIPVYEHILQKALERGYRFVSHKEFFYLVQAGKAKVGKLFLIRHDIDTDPELCDQWLRVELKYNIKTSYYFRLKTLDLELMNFIHRQGIHCGYHYEELSTFAKKKGIKDMDVLRSRYSEIREMFRQNLLSLNQSLDFKIESIASHGDFANRVFGASNFDFVDRSLLDECGLLFECYDPLFLENYTAIISDYEYPNFYRGNKDVLQAIEDDEQVIHYLVHPKHWRANWFWNTKENINRLIEGIFYRYAK